MATGMMLLGCEVDHARVTTPSTGGRESRSAGARHWVTPGHGLYTWSVPRGDGRLTHDLDPQDAGPQDACGVFGVWAPGEEVAKLTYFGLYALQHRGQE